MFPTPIYSENCFYIRTKMRHSAIKHLLSYYANPFELDKSIIILQW